MSKKFMLLLLVLSFALTLLLAACGSDTPATASGGGATSGSNGSSTEAAPSIPGVSEVSLDSSINDALKTALGKSYGDVKDLSYHIYSSDSEVNKLTDDAQATLTGAGYKYVSLYDPTETKMMVDQNSAVGSFTKDGAADLILNIGEAKALTQSAGIPGVDKAVFQKFADQFKDKKSTLQIIMGTNLVKTRLDAATATAKADSGSFTATAGAMTGSFTATAGAMVSATAAVVAAAAPKVEAIIPAYPNGKRADAAGYISGSSTKLIYITSDDADTVSKNYQQTLASKGFSQPDISQSNANTEIYASLNSQSVVVTIHPTSNRAADDKYLVEDSGAGPNDTIIEVYYTFS